MTVFYRKYRPQKFADLVGQDSIRETLLAQLNSGKLSHGYLFAGPRGTGKTSTARIFAKAVNCKLYLKSAKNPKYGEPCNKCESCLAVADGSHLDLIEIDAASNRGIDEIRDLREKIKLSPVSSKFKVYIIDEAHMLTTEAFNALLKTLEEPPAHAIFILCTTAANKLPATIISRLSRFNFLRATEEDLVTDLKKVVKAEGLLVEDGALSGIAKVADGSYRDAESLLDQLASAGKKIKVSQVKDIGGISGWNQIFDFAKTVANDDLKTSILLVEKLAREGGDISLFLRELVLVFEKLLLLKVGAKDEAFFDTDKVQKPDLEELSQRFSFVQLQNIMKLFLIAESEIKIYPLPKIPLILAVCKICKEPSFENVVEQTVEVANKKPDMEILPGKHETGEKPSLKPQKAKKGQLKSIAVVEEKWGDFLAKVRPANAHLVALLKSTRPSDVSDDILTVEVFYRFHKDKLEEPKIIQMLEKFLEEIFSTKVSLRFVLSQKQTKAPAAVARSDVVDVSGEDLSAIASEIFSK